MASLQPLPGGTSHFAELRARNELYVDKTAYIADMLDGYSKYCFLARPRRFGKSLLVSTLECLFQGRAALFRGTQMEGRTPQSPNWTWPDPVPVIRFNMEMWHTLDAATLHNGLHAYIVDYFDQFQLPQPRGARDASTLFRNLLAARAATSGKVVVLIDEYDYPLLHNLENPALPEIQAALANFYGALKSSDEHLRFVFFTGITRFARTSLFSGLNNLRDLSHDLRFNGLLGFTEREMQTRLRPYMTDLTDNRRRPIADAAARMREYYNGYLFAPGAPDDARVYNPYSVLTCLNEKALHHYWIDTGVPFFLPQMLKRHDCDMRDVHRIPSREVVRGALQPDQLAALWRNPRAAGTSALDWAKPALAQVLFQTGYLTLRFDPDSDDYVTDFPNLEVAASFIQELLAHALWTASLPCAHSADVCQALLARDPDALRQAGNRLLASLTHLEHAPSENCYQSLLHLALLSLQYRADAQAEVNLHRGRPDLVVAFAREVVILELKLDDAPDDPQAQAARQAYPERYTQQGQTVQVWGLIIGRQEREILTISSQRYPAHGGIKD